MRTAFPEVSLHTGDGALYWAGGMRFGFEQVRASEWEYLLVYNDDVSLETDAVARLLSVADALREEGDRSVAVVGAFNEPGSDRVAYGGLRRCSAWHRLKFRWLEGASVPQDCDTLNMNLALISREAIDAIGFLADYFVHRGADYEFGLRLRAAGGRVVVAPGFIGECERNPSTETSAKPGLTVAERWRRLTSVKEQPPRERAAYYRAHGGVLWPLLWCLPYVKVLLSGIFGPGREQGS